MVTVSGDGLANRPRATILLFITTLVQLRPGVTLSFFAKCRNAQCRQRDPQSRQTLRLPWGRGRHDRARPRRVIAVL